LACVSEIAALSTTTAYALAAPTILAREVPGGTGGSCESRRGREITEGDDVTSDEAADGEVSVSSGLCDRRTDEGEGGREERDEFERVVHFPFLTVCFESQGFEGEGIKEWRWK
jgi:hypothetical protein